MQIWEDALTLCHSGGSSSPDKFTLKTSVTSVAVPKFVPGTCTGTICAGYPPPSAGGAGGGAGGAKGGAGGAEAAYTGPDCTPAKRPSPPLIVAIDSGGVQVLVLVLHMSLFPLSSSPYLVSPMPMHSRLDFDE